MTLSWKAVRRGSIFCAPACGANCTLAAFEAATKRAAALAKRLGNGWKPRVWENLGWHYSVIDRTGYWKVHANYYDKELTGYTAFFGIKESSGGRWAERGKTPEEAIKNMQEKVHDEALELSKLVVLLENVEVKRLAGPHSTRRRTSGVGKRRLARK